LLIGAETFGLTGVGNDVEAMAERLERRGFGVQCRLGADAARAGILTDLERLARDSREADRVVVYFSGHGGVVTAPAPSTTRVPLRRLQFLVPTDYNIASGDFHGITTAEVSVLLARLAQRTPNVVVVVDACHASNMVRDHGVRVKALRRPAYLDVAGHLERLELDTRGLHGLGNPNVVRLAACQRDRSAYEYTNPAGRRMGVFTEALCRELDQAGDDGVTWSTLFRRVRTRLQSDGWEQRPEAEGPAHRLLFDWRSTSEPAVLVQRDFGAAVFIEWGVVVDGEPRPLRPKGATLTTGDHLYVRARNDSRATAYLAMVELDEWDRASLVTTLDPSGAAVRPGDWYAVGYNELTGRWTGMSLERDLHGSRVVRFAVVVSSAPQNLPAPSGRVREIRLAPTPVRSDIHVIEVLLLPADGRPGLG
jgi:hypothetical protein